jgi:hypothetical protein
MRCQALTKAGDQCQLTASYGSYCHAHAPETAERRRDYASKGGKTSGRGRGSAGEIPTLRREIRDLIDEIRNGSIAFESSSLILRCYRALMQLEEIRLRAVEAEQLRSDVEDLKRAAYGELR